VNWQTQELDWPEDPSPVVRSFAADGEVAWLDSQGAVRSPGDSGRSLICIDPVARIEQEAGRPARFLIRERTVAESRSAWDLWREVQRRLPRLKRLEDGVSPGWTGYVGFESAAMLEARVPQREQMQPLPIVRLSLFDHGVVLDPAARQARLLVAPGIREAMGISPGVDTGEIRELWNSAAARSGGTRAAGAHRQRRICFHATTPRVVELLDAAAYERTVARALEYIAAGDIYQVNLSHAIRLSGLPDPWTCFRRILRVNPAPCAALLSWPGEPPAAVVSASPELFLRLRGDAVLTRPIKGTRPRSGDETLDRARRLELLSSAKDAAELAMIVDLHRNDLGRVCVPGTVRVPAPRRLETHPRVYHTVADVVGRLARGRDALDLLAACFPAGSISGVPKIRALQIIHELEHGPRGVYTGSIGVIGLDGQMTMNVAIRTMCMRGDAGQLHVGGGVVADSDPAEEYEETLAKARGILEALAAEASAAAAASSPPRSASIP
jgi:para-aminobenzoate synthetase component 1